MPQPYQSKDPDLWFYVDTDGRLKLARCGKHSFVEESPKEPEPAVDPFEGLYD